MGIQLDQEVLGILKEKETVKVLATVDENGVPHAVFKQSIQVDDNGRLLYLELLESSQTNKNLTGSIWFNRQVAIILKSKDGRSIQIKGRPERVAVCGPLFQKHYISLRERANNFDLAAVWIIEPEELIDETYQVRKNYEKANRPYFVHLDQIAK